jgi:predicted Zn-dependent protease
MIPESSPQTERRFFREGLPWLIAAAALAAYLAKVNPWVTLNSLSLTARVNRAFAYFRAGRLAEAESDYQALLKAFPTNHQALEGLAEIARQTGDANAAIRYYQRSLSQTVAGSPEARAVTARLKAPQQ